jgi:hypothetical protein
METVICRARLRLSMKAGFQLSSSLIFAHERIASIDFSDWAAMTAGTVTKVVRVGSDNRLNQGER